MGYYLDMRRKIKETCGILKLLIFFNKALFAAYSRIDWARLRKKKYFFKFHEIPELIFSGFRTDNQE